MKKAMSLRQIFMKKMNLIKIWVWIIIKKKIYMNLQKKWEKKKIIIIKWIAKKIKKMTMKNLAYLIRV